LLLTLFANVAYFSALSFDDVARATTVGLVLTPSLLPLCDGNLRGPDI